MRVIGLFIVLFLFSAAGVVVAAAQEGALPTEVRGLIISKLRTTLSAEIEAPVIAIGVELGQNFNKAKPLIRLADKVYRAQLERAQSELRSARLVLNAKQKLYQLQSIGELEMAQSQTRVDLAQSDVLLYQLQLQRCVVNAPFRGRVVEVLVRNHQFVTAGTPLLEIIDDRHLLIQAFIPSAKSGSVGIGQIFKVYVDEVRRSYSAKVTLLGAVVDPNSRMLELRGVIKGEHSELLPGMSGQILFDASGEREAQDREIIDE